MNEFLQHISYGKWSGVKGVEAVAYTTESQHILPLTAFDLFSQGEINTAQFLDLINYEHWRHDVTSVQAEIPNDYNIHLGIIPFEELTR